MGSSDLLERLKAQAEASGYRVVAADTDRGGDYLPADQFLVEGPDGQLLRIAVEPA